MNKLSSIALLLAMVVAGAAWYYREDSKLARQALGVYQGNNDVLIGRLKKVYADKMETDKRNEELEKAAASAKFDWLAVIDDDDPVLMCLRQKN